MRHGTDLTTGVHLLPVAEEIGPNAKWEP